MAGASTANSSQFAQYSAGGVANLVTGSWGAPLLTAVMEHTVDANLLDDTAVISMGRLPKGARVLGYSFGSTQLDGATTMTVRVGGTPIGATNGITALNHATNRQFLHSALAASINTPLTEDATVDLLLAGADVGAASVGDKFTLVVYYVMA